VSGRGDVLVIERDGGEAGPAAEVGPGDIALGQGVGRIVLPEGAGGFEHLGERPVVLPGQPPGQTVLAATLQAAFRPS
jgi:hypothetical protein